VHWLPAALLLGIVDQPWQFDGLLYSILVFLAFLLDPGEFPYVWLCVSLSIALLPYITLHEICRYQKKTY